MAKPLTKSWQEALKLVRDCKIVRRPQLIENGSKLLVMLEDPMGQRFVLSLLAVSVPKRVGNMLTFSEGFLIEALELEPGEVWEEE